jgi:hypothetical protein
MTDEKKTRKTNPLRWVARLELSSQGAGDLLAALSRLLPADMLTDFTDAEIAIGPEHNTVAAARSWLLAHGPAGAATFDLHRVTDRGLVVEQTRALKKKSQPKE